MSKSRALVKHIEAINAKSEAWVAEDPENRFAGMLVTLPDHWADYDVYTPEEFDRYQTEQDFYEIYKSVYGFRPSSMLMEEYTDEELKIEVDGLYERAEAELEDVRELTEFMDIEEASWEMDCMFEDKEAAELHDASTKWDDIAEDFDDVTKVKQIFH